MHFSWFHLIPALEKYPDHVLTAGLCTLLIVFISLTARAVAGTPEEALIPAPTISLRNFFEVVVQSLDSFVDSVVGHDGKIYVGVIASLFIYIFLNNVLGLFPGFSPATDNLNTTLAVGLFSFVLYNFEGVRAHGFAYFKHFLGPLIWLAPLMLPIELISHLVRPLSLGLRLFGNMTGDHTVLSIFLNLVPVGVPMIFYGLGLFVCFVQAFVFSLLSMVYFINGKRLTIINILGGFHRMKKLVRSVVSIGLGMSAVLLAAAPALAQDAAAGAKSPLEWFSCGYRNRHRRPGWSSRSR